MQSTQENWSQLLKEAVRLHRAGSLEQAATNFIAVLEAQPNQFDALHYLGIVRYQQGRPREGLDHIRAALKINPADIAALTNLGAILGKLGRPEEALESYDKALAIKPGFAETLNNRGNTLRNLGRPEEALESFDKALAIKPDYVEALYNRGLTLTYLARLEEALASYDGALALRPDHVEALCNRGAALADLKQPEEALASCDKALAIRPDHVEALCNRGKALADLKRPEEALDCYDKALAIKPDLAEALYNRGVTLAKLERPEEALASYEKALAVRPDYEEALCNRGGALADLKRPEEALASCDRALSIRPDFAEALNNRGNALANLKRPGEAVASYDKALAIKPDYAEALYNRGVTLANLERPVEALASYDKALEIRPDYVEALGNRGGALVDLRRLEEALASFDKALEIRPDYAEARRDRGMTTLLLGDFIAGWRDYEHRWDVKDAPRRKLVAPWPIWKGGDIKAKRIIVYEEQGLGDVIQFSRFLTPLSALGASVTFLVRSSLHRLLRPFATTIRLVDKPPRGESFDFQCALLSLPGAFATTIETAPSDIPYLISEAALIADWRRRIGVHGFRIGICWQGNPAAKADVGRSIPLRCFHAIAAISGVRLISLQKTYGLDQLSNLPPGMAIETFGAEFDSGPDAFIDTAAVMSCLDLIITCDTSVAHLAGALGRPVWVVLEHVPDWRWMLDRSDSLWYPTMKLYRQSVRGDWDGLFQHIARDVAKLCVGDAGRGSALTRPPPPAIDA